MSLPSSPTPAHEERIGVFCALGAFLLWGVFPLYWGLLRDVNALEITAHRVLWMIPACLLIAAAGGQLGKVRALLTTPRLLPILGVSAGLISFNWALYVWAATHGEVLQASLGYFISPLLNVLTGMLFFHERLRPLQWAAVALAAVGVLYAGLAQGAFPLLGLSLALSFAAYAAVRKAAPVASIPGVLAEAVLIAPLALGWLMLQSSRGAALFLSGDPVIDLLLIGGGAMTAAPLLLYGVAARRLQISTLGLLFYINPSLQFLVGAMIQGEPVTTPRLILFGFVWVGLGLFTWDRRRQARRRREAAL